MAGDNNDTEHDDGEGEGEQPQPDLKELRRAANKSKENAARADKLERSFAFAKVVGMDKVEHPLVQALMDRYDGDLEAEKIKEHLEAMQVMSLLNAAPTGEAGPGDGQQQPAGDGQAQLRTGTIDGGEVTPVDSQHPATAGLTAAFDLMDQGATREDAATAFFAKVWEAAAKGDQRVLTQSNSETAAEVGA